MWEKIDLKDYLSGEGKVMKISQERYWEKSKQKNKQTNGIGEIQFACVYAQGSCIHVP